jgi:hypothetical protein
MRRPTQVNLHFEFDKYDEDKLTIAHSHPMSQATESFSRMASVGLSADARGCEPVRSCATFLSNMASLSGVSKWGKFNRGAECPIVRKCEYSRKNHNLRISTDEEMTHDPILISFFPLNVQSHTIVDI